MTRECFDAIALELKNAITGSEFQNNVFIAGGAVRSLIMNKEISDIDIAVNMIDGGTAFAEFLCRRGVAKSSPAMFPKYGVAMVHLKNFSGEKIECVYTRCEKYPDMSTRNPDTEFGTLEEDCFRRDFTINSLYYDVCTGDIIDFTGRGKDDIHRKLIKTTGNPDIIFQDDPLRILRGIRFAVKLGFYIDADTYAGMKTHSSRISILSQERITSEFTKILESDYPTRGLSMLDDIGAMKFILPEFPKFDESKVFNHSLEVLSKIKSKSISLRLAALLHEIEKPGCPFMNHECLSAQVAKNVLARMKFPTKIINEVHWLIRNQSVLWPYKDDLSDMEDSNKRKIMYDCKAKERFNALCELIHADNISPQFDEQCLPRQINVLKDFAAKEKRMFSYQLPVNGNDIKHALNDKLTCPKDVGTYLELAKQVSFKNPYIDKSTLLEVLVSLDIKKTQ